MKLQHSDWRADLVKDLKKIPLDFIKNIVQIERKLDSPLNCKKIGTNWKKQEKPTLCPKLSTQLYFVECMVDPYRCPCLFKILVEVTLAPLYANEKEQ